MYLMVKWASTKQVEQLNDDGKVVATLPIKEMSLMNAVSEEGIIKAIYHNNGNVVGTDLHFRYKK